jgi:lipid II:glycine glycyltransferase (peptidoglycan interpeptide bridge formation enzyme)
MFSYSISRSNEDGWYGILDEFQDANVFQTIPFCSTSSRSEGMEHLIVREGRDPVAAAQVRLLPIPFTTRTIAYVFWGPLFHRRNTQQNWTALAEALRVLRQEYVFERKICVRIMPPTMTEHETEWRSIFENTGYLYSESKKNSRTIIINLAATIEELRKGLDKKWRNCLNAAERNILSIQEGCDDSMFEVFLGMYREMLSRKRIAEPGDIRRFRAMQRVLPDHFKMKVFVARDQSSKACAGAICSAIGRRGIFLFGATSSDGLKSKASYLLQWRVIQWLKESGCVEYDLHGSNAESNPGVYAFKMGLCGRNGKEVAAIGSFEAYDGTTARVFLKTADYANRTFKQLKSLYQQHHRLRG